jgi:four helix bundle protein
MTPDELEDRLIDFAARIVRVCLRLRKTALGRHIADQMLRSGTASAANYGEARGAESPADFIHKLKIVQKELNETSVWLRIIIRAGLVKPELIVALLAENKELAKVITASIKTKRANETLKMTSGK